MHVIRAVALGQMVSRPLNLAGNEAKSPAMSSTRQSISPYEGNAPSRPRLVLSWYAIMDCYE